MLLDIIILIVVSLFLRILPRLVRPQAVSSDTYYHLAAAEAIRLNGFRIPQRLPGYCLDTPFDYPPLFHYLLAVFPKSARERLEPYINAMIDTARVVLIYWAVGLVLENIVSSSGAFWVALFLATAPGLLNAGTGPRAYQATPRPLAEMLFDATMLIALWSLRTDGWPAMVAAMFMGGLVLLSAKFAAQALLIVGVVIGIGLPSPFAGLLPIAAMAVAYLLSGGYYARVLRGQIGHLYFFRRITVRKYLITRNKNRLADLRSLPHDLWHEPSKAGRILFLNNSYFIATIRNPVLFLMPWILDALALREGIEVRFLTLWITGTLVAFSLTSLKPAMFLGEAERYFDYSTLPQYLLLWFGASHLPWLRGLLPWILGYHLLLYVIYVVLFARLFPVRSELDSLKEESHAFLQQYPRRLRLLPIGSTYELAYKCGQDVFFPSGNFSAAYLSEKEFNDLYVIHGFPSQNLKTLMDRYGLNAIYATNRALRTAAHHGISYDFNGFSMLFDNKECIIYGYGASR